MSDAKFIEYLVLGGLRHGEVWLGPFSHESIELPAKAEKRIGKFYSRETKAEVTTPLNDTYFIHEFSLENGKRYMIASAEPLSSFDVKKEIEAASPPLKPID
ncbi:hypothetical protein RN053_21020 [Pantoea dispersa]|uniref:hypothetical protein n=1 Tax=Pantoea dispersa TaxID=59814 RepID=UPI0028DD9FD0|nr:hypothetical protein [Pantoea dispersa]MDT8852995.1 hypothetical protein [Pantoea dispersa]